MMLSSLQSPAVFKSSFHRRNKLLFYFATSTGPSESVEGAKSPFSSDFGSNRSPTFNSSSYFTPQIVKPSNATLLPCPNVVKGG